MDTKSSIPTTMLPLNTETEQNLLVSSDHVIYHAACSLIQNGGVLLWGDTGSGKSMTLEALGDAQNLKLLFQDTPYAGLEFEIHTLDIDMSTIQSGQELYYEPQLRLNGSYKDPGLLGSFLEKHGFSSKADMEKFMAQREDCVTKGKGVVVLYLARFDEADRVHVIEILNSILKIFSSRKFYLPHIKQERYLPIQGIMTSNSSCAKSNEYAAAAGMDMALANRCTIFHMGNKNITPLLLTLYEKQATPPQLEMIAKIGNVIEDIMCAIHEEHAYQEIGMITLRQVHPLVRNFLRGAYTAEEAVKSLSYGLANAEDIEKMNLSIATHFNPSTKHRKMAQSRWS